jgi:hypothetical protein
MLKARRFYIYFSPWLSGEGKGVSFAKMAELRSSVSRCLLKDKTFLALRILIKGKYTRRAQGSWSR